ncbi:MAG: hypothetical protein ABWY56_17380 [Propionibacteriaceae bacterium]
MAVASGANALAALTALIGPEKVPAQTLLHAPGYLPEEITAANGANAMEPDTLIGGYGNETSYQLGGGDAELASRIAGPPVEALAGPQASAGDPLAAEYVRTSLDLTMQGGTTSGVVYPLAVCELATSFRFRNVGGASAGAIAAALTAAAELGRSELARHPELAAQVESEAQGDIEPGRPHIRRGFVGLTDIISWLTQTRPSDASRDEFRLAQMFRPGVQTRNLFRVAVAAMRQRTWSLPLLALMAFRPWTRVLAGVLILATVVLTGWLGGVFSGTPRSVAGVLGWGLVDSATFVATVVGIVILLKLAPLVRRKRARRADRSPVWLGLLRQVTSRLGEPRQETLLRLLPGVVLVGAVAALAYTRPAGYAAAVVVGLAGSFVVIIVLLVAAMDYVNQLRDKSFGLLAGTTAPVRQRNLLDLLAGVPAQTVEQSVVPWLNDCLGQLAGLPAGEVLRFGHLWHGADFHEVRHEASPALLAAWQQASERTDHRLVNLELMTTDLTRQRPYRFPLPANQTPDDQLWLCLDQLKSVDGDLFPESVLTALAAGPTRTVADRSGTKHTLHQLPEPWDLPVIFAVRLSMALPVLFRAVQMYRIVARTPVQDDFGRDLSFNERTLEWPEVRGLADEVWFSDGGITSNFPVHFFDSSLPRWPTVSLNLGSHPEWAPHQDVSLPQDWDVATIPVQPLSDTGLSLGAAVFDTAMSWRDNMQSAMPGYRNRIAQVRTRSDEGGANLFMAREAVASMALRGALAGARLRTRFSNPKQWDRFRWLRLRVALSNLERHRGTVQDRQRFYADALAAPTWLNHHQDEFCDQPFAQPIDWYRPPSESFWPDAPDFLSSFAQAYVPPVDPQCNVMTVNIPRPEPVLRQVPQE